MRRVRSMSFRWRFAVTSGLLLTLVALALGQLLGQRIEERAQRSAEQTAVIAARLGLAPLIDPEDFVGVLPADVRRELGRALVLAAEEGTATENDIGEVLRVKIFNAGGTVVYSDLDEIVGKTYESADVSRALEGRLVSKFTTLSDADESADRSIQEALEVYVPLHYGGEQPVGVAEVYLPYEPVAAAIARDRLILYAALAGALVAFFLIMFRMVSRTSRAMLESAERNEYLAFHDSLTGLPNRALLTERLRWAIVGARRHGHDAAVLLIDLDRFKEINDTLGHDTGDELLRQTGKRLSEQLREIDTVARLGGDEFVVLLPEVEGVDGARLVANRLLDALHQPFQIHGVDLAVEASIGIACFPEHGATTGLLVQHADVAMYAAKRVRGACAVYDATSDVSSLSSLTLLNELRIALEQRQLVLHYQPKEELADGTVRSVEALVRWQHPTRGLLAPDTFVAVAEQTGLITHLTTYVLSEALAQVRRWQDEGRDLAMAVNLSARNLMDEHLPALVASLLEENGVAPDRLEVEVTETSTMIDEARATGVLVALAELGVAITVDDYGTGYSSLSYLRGLPIGTLKIDRSFVTGFLTNQDNAVIVRSTIELAQNLGLRVVAEGVEDRETHDALIALGCHVAQGYYLSRPVPPEALTELLDARAGEPHGDGDLVGA